MLADGRISVQLIVCKKDALTAFENVDEVMKVFQKI